MIVQLAPLPVDDGYRRPDLGEIVELWREAAPEKWLGREGDKVRVLIAHSMAPVGADLLDRMPNLQLIANFGTGVDNIDLDRAREAGMTVTRTPDLLADDVADLALLLMMGALRRLAEADRYVKAGRWPHQRFPLGRTAHGRNLGIFGLGRIGSQIARRAEVIGMDIGYCARSRKQVPHDFFPSITKLARWSDVLILCAPGGEETRHIVDADVLTALGSDGILVNVSRGSLVDESALEAALAAGTISAAALDVFENEPHVGTGLRNQDQLLATPHIGSATIETRRAMADQVYGNVCAWLAGEPLEDVLIHEGNLIVG